ncbi:uncharacterized protein LOC129579505 [Sitodiplosis mosellana]|uniref:uncharacterized protein LOC129579505 n=1 Tax=Sitodiplosis mosellana TaxID=263140 RepID=UPI002444A7B0|nr:uncharacterized protein LOC129579505 [Sitodiplosis mosellana]
MDYPVDISSIKQEEDTPMDYLELELEIVPRPILPIGQTMIDDDIDLPSSLDDRNCMLLDISSPRENLPMERLTMIDDENYSNRNLNEANAPVPRQTLAMRRLTMIDDENYSNHNLDENNTPIPRETLIIRQLAMIDDENHSNRNLDEANTPMPREALPMRRLAMFDDHNYSNPNIENDALMDHVLLPRVLPQKTPENLLSTELKIISEMIRIADNWATKWLPQKTAELLQMLQSFHIECTPHIVWESINNLHSGDNFAMFVRTQLCGIMIHVPPDESSDDVIVATFPGSLDSTEIYSRDSGIQFNYPEKAIKVKCSQMLLSHEFSNQLCVLSDSLPVGYKHLDCVSKWLLTLLMDENSTEAEFPAITKKVRDEVWGSGENFFRRSSFYISIKAMIQHYLTLKLGADAGKLLYKIFMLKFLVVTYAPYQEGDRFNIDLLSQAIAKLARRIEKLSDMTVADDMIDLYEATVDEAKKTIETIREKITDQINEMHIIDINAARLHPLTGLNFESDICYKMTKLDDYLNNRETDAPQTDNGFKTPIFTTYKRYFQTGIPAFNCLRKVTGEIDHRIFWIDFEQIILYEMEIRNKRLSAVDLRKWSIAYAKFAATKYEKDPLLISRMLLVRLKIIAILDAMATEKYPLLKEHRSGVKTKIIDYLLLPQSTDMHIAFEIEKYFSDRDEKAIGPSLIEQETVDESSFSAKFVKGNWRMKRICQEIWAKDKENVERTKAEWNKKRKEANKLRSQANNMVCKYISGQNNRKLHSPACENCALKRRAADVTIEPYEHLLPKNKTNQFAIVFELEIPDEIACLRDLLYVFAEFCHGEPKTMKIKELLSNKKLAQYNNSASQCVKLGSTKNRKMKKFSVEKCTLKNIIVHNTFNCIFYGTKKRALSFPTDDLFKDICTLKAQHEYIGLQWALHGTQHTENEVLSSQSECGTDLTLSEYKNFCSLRSDGHRLQIRKLYAMIETEALSFEREDVLALVMQTLWECEVSGDGDFVREAHIDFRDDKFCGAIIELLGKFVEQQKNNWTHPFKILIVALIAVRAFEINETNALANKIVKILCRIRSIALEWIDKIGTCIQDMTNPDETTERSLRLKLIYVAIIGGLTFFVHPKHKNFQNIFPNNTASRTAVESWLQFNISLNNNVRLYTNDEGRLSSNLRMFLRLIERVGVSLEEKVSEVIERDRKFIFALIKQQWPRAKSANFVEIDFDQRFPHILIAQTNVGSTSHTVSIDIITGAFLVDHLPLSRLPGKVMDSNIYKRFFEDVVLEVQPDAQRNFSTLLKYNDCSYEFKMVNDHVIVIEKKVREFEKELIDQSVFHDDFPHNLVNDYNHWWNKYDNCIEFRRRTFGKKHFSKETTIDYRLNLNNKHLIHEQTQRPMLDIKSDSYKKITDQLYRLEHPKYIHVLYDVETEETKVVLWRMNLKFTVKCLDNEYYLVSNEFNEMRVIHDQKIATLCGLNHGLVLESEKKETKFILIPNGQIRINNQDVFPSVSINTMDELQNPPFYKYQVDKFCCQLKSTNDTHASWFYLAYLHAVTSHGEVEPFTKMTGTERAIQILQSAFAWSSAPYEPEAIKMLKKIANLTPHRELKEDTHIQSVTWPTNVLPHSAQDCFVFIANKLVEDSQRLCSLHGKKPDNKLIELKTNLKLNERDHRRCQQLNPNLGLSNTFMGRKMMETLPTRQNRVHFSDDTRTVCILHHMRQFMVPSNFRLKPFLTGDAEKTLDGLGNSDRIKDILNHSVHVELRDLWISLYDAAIEEKLTPEQFTIILSFYANNAKEDINAILALQAVAANLDAFKDIKPPKKNTFPIFAGTFNTEEVSGLLKQYYTQPSQYSEWPMKEQGIHKVQLTSIMDDIRAEIISKWPCTSFDFTHRWPFEYIDFDAANAAINERLKNWYANDELYNFIKEVQSRIRTLNGIGSVQVHPCLAPTSTPETRCQTLIDFKAKMRKAFEQSSEEEKQQIEEAKNTWQGKAFSLYSALDWWTIYTNIFENSIETSHLVQAGIFPRMAPSLLLPKLTDSNVDDDQRFLIGAFGLAIAREQRENRMDAYLKRPESQAALDREMDNIPYENWSPHEYPEWLLFEIEQNLTIRRIQIEIAKRMIDPPKIETKHSVMQLNMGEGKTKVIVPILAARLADGTLVCQIIVLKSLFATNLKSLRQYLGGFLNRRVYIFPCRRDMPIESNARKILDIYEECKREKGVILTLPEYRLSFQLKIYQSIASQLKSNENRDYTKAKILLDMLKWTNTNVRSILDESDAILNAKYQLIYTVGSYMQPDGDSHRWLVTQAVLKLVPIHMHWLYLKYGKEKVEFGQNCGAECRPDEFIHCRILDETIFEDLKNALIDDFFAGRLDIDFPGVDDTKKPSVKHLLGSEENKGQFDDKSAKKAIEKFSKDKQNIIWILSGLLRFEVLKLALTKRWRVNYGVDVKGKRKMAVPFKAKDVAAEMAEFGHPDVAVCFTQMSYYYSGLSDAELFQVFNILEDSSDKANIYAKWISGIPNDQVDASIESYSGINLDDPDQRNDVLFPLFRRNMNVIDFWLSNVVYPQELKIFKKKLMCTAWDLCSEHLEHRVTGFSGTNDTKDILPVTISQNDLAELERTNEEMRQILLSPKNMVYEKSAKVSTEILQELVQRDIRVLLDSGALMLELNNKETAVEWLKLALDRDAAIYFDEQDILQTIDRNGCVVEFDYSVYRENLSTCVVYLDDAHTRGTDLKFPSNWMACVTLSGDITCDKTVQSCMRMRELKTTQSILFWPSHEADIRLRELSGQRKVEIKHVMQFIENNSNLFKTANMTHWAADALNYTKKMSGHKKYEISLGNAIDDSSLEALYMTCVDDDLFELEVMYSEKKEAKLHDIIWKKFDTLVFDYKGPHFKAIKKFIGNMQDSVWEKLQELAPSVERFTTLDEEQEKELEQEVEEQAQIQRPRCAEATMPRFDDRLKRLVLDGIGSDGIFNDMIAQGALLSIVESLSNTQMFEFCEKNDDAWASHLLVTKDFTMVIKNQPQACNDFLRPVFWVACIKNPGAKNILILLSSFECNQLIPAFRKSGHATLFMYRPRLSNLHSNLIHDVGLQLTGMAKANSIAVEDEVQIGVYSGLMYFANEDEQNAYCNFLGLIPGPWTSEQKEAFDDGNIEESGYVPIKKRKYIKDISPGVSQCKFKENPTDFAIKLIKAHHQVLPKDSHVASILNRGIKSLGKEEAMEIE